MPMRFHGLWAMVLVTACYRYSPSTGPALTPGTSVRISLAPTADGRLAAVLGEGTIGLEGRVLTASETGYEISMGATLKRPVIGVSSRVVWAGETVSVPREAVTSVEIRSLDRKRTTRAMVLGTVGALVAVKLVVAAIGGGSGGDDGGGVITPP
jgi:hypothetical protein